MTKTFCLLTKTYRGDLEAFTKLCESIDRHMPQVRHYVVVDRSDRSLFAPFASGQRMIVECSQLLPGFRELQLGKKRVWLRWPRHFVRGWIFQQLSKLAAVSRLQEDAVILIDSDVILLRPIAAHHVFEGDRTKLYHNPGAQSGPASESDKWHGVASLALGLEPQGYTGSDYISNVICWSPKVVRALLERIEQVTAGKWHDALIRHFRFSEYVLYGVFCDHVAGPHQALVSHTRAPLCQSSWQFDLATAAGADGYIAGLGADTVAANVQSNLGLDAGTRDAIYARASAKAQQDDRRA